MDDEGASRLEAIVADAGVLLVQMDKFRARHTDQARELRAAALAVADRARRAHRRGELDPETAASLAVEATAARDALARWLAALRASAPYRGAVAALAAGDADALWPPLLQVYDGASVVAPPARLHLAVPWQRRGRPRPPADIAANVERLRIEGFPGERDAEAPGVDPDLPAIGLMRAPPLGAPVHLVVEAEALPPTLLAVAASDELFVPGARLVIPFAVTLASPTDELDEWLLDPAPFLSELEAALRARGLPIVG